MGACVVAEIGGPEHFSDDDEVDVAVDGVDDA